MDSSPNLVSERSLGCAPQNSSGTFEEPRTTRAGTKRAKTGNSSNNGEVTTQSVLKGSFFALQFMAARPKILCAIQISRPLTAHLCRNFEGRSVSGHWALLRRNLRSGEIWTWILGSWCNNTEKLWSMISDENSFLLILGIVGGWNFIVIFLHGFLVVQRSRSSDDGWDKGCILSYHQRGIQWRRSKARHHFTSTTQLFCWRG